MTPWYTPAGSSERVVLRHSGLAALGSRDYAFFCTTLRVLPHSSHSSIARRLAAFDDKTCLEQLPKGSEKKTLMIIPCNISLSDKEFSSSGGTAEISDTHPEKFFF